MWLGRNPRLEHTFIDEDQMRVLKGALVFLVRLKRVLSFALRMGKRIFEDAWEA